MPALPPITAVLQDGKTPGERLNLVDRVVSFFAPVTGLRRMAARQSLHQFGADLAAHTRRGGSGGKTQNANSESWIRNRDRIRQIWDARDMAAFDWIGGTLARVVMYVVGELEAKGNTGDPELDALYDDYFHNWCGDEVDDDGLHRCDLTGRHRLIKMVQMALLAMFVDGDHGFIACLDPDPEKAAEEKDIQFQQIESDRLGSPLELQIQENYIGGVGLDPATGRVEFYRVFNRTRTGMYNNPREIEPANFLHLWDPERSDQYRGVTHLRKVLHHARDLREWVEGEKLAGKVQTQFAAMVGSKDPYAKSGVGAWEGRTAAGTPTQEAQWGKILKLAESESFSLLAPPNRPSGGFLAFVQVVIRMIAVALDLPYGFVWDLATLGGQTARIEVRQAERKIRYWQRLLRDRILSRVRKMVLARGVALEHIPFHPLMNRCDWAFGPYLITDVGYETQNDIAMVSSGIVPVRAIASKYASDPIETARSNAAVISGLQAISAETRVPIEMLAGGLWPTASQLLAATNTPAPPPPEPGSQAAVGDKGAAQIVDLLSKVTTGQLDRASAVQTLITVYGIPQDVAEGITPVAGKPELKEHEVL